jgi:C-terminal processing protease CtpA/Prc
MSFIGHFAFGLIAIAALSSCTQQPGLSPAAGYMSFDQFKLVDAGSVLATPACGDKPIRSVLKEPKSCQELRQEFRYVVYVGKQIYVYWKEKKAETGTDYDALATLLEEKITDETTLSQYYFDVLRTWAAAFNDGHVNGMTDDRSKIEVVSTGIRLRVLGAASASERVVVASSKNSDVPVGAKILRINGKPINDVVSDYAAITSGSTARMRRFHGGARALDANGVEKSLEPLEVELLPMGAATARTVTLPRSIEINLPDAVKPAVAPPTGEALVQVKLLPGAIGYLKIDGFSGTRLSDVFDRAMDQLKNTKGLVIDVRENGGGDMSGNRVLRWLTKQTIVRYNISPRKHDYLLAHRPEYFFLPDNPLEPLYYGWTKFEVKPTEANEGTYAGKPVAVVISPYCFSACDTFVSAIQTNKLGTVVGEGSGGGTGSPHVFELPNTGFKFRYSVVRGMNVAMKPIEGVGTIPDVPVEYSEADVKLDSISDSQTLKAAAFVREKLGMPALEPGPVVHVTRPLNVKRPDLSATSEEIVLTEELSRIRE